MVTLIDDDVAIILDQGIDLALARQRLHHCDVDLARRSGLAAAVTVLPKAVGAHSTPASWRSIATTAAS